MNRITAYLNTARLYAKWGEPQKCLRVVRVVWHVFGRRK